jgi:nucleoside-diphosphate-sugar epimerase
MRHGIVEEDLGHILSGTSHLPWNRLEGKTVLVTGAAGFLPAYMVETLLWCNERPGWNKTQVIGLVRNAERAAARFDAYRGRPDLRLLVQDAAEPVHVDRHVDFIIHAASQASPKYFRQDPVGTLAPNVLGTHHLLGLAREHGVEGFLFFSSGEVYGQVDKNRAPFDEQCYGSLDPTDVRSCYAESKRMGETLCASWHAQYGVPATIARIFHTYGPGMRLDDGRVFADFVGDVVARRPIRMKSDGSARRVFCYLADAAAAFFTVLLNGQGGQAYNVANDRAECSMAELANLLVGLFPERGLSVVREERRAEDSYLPSRLVQAVAPDIRKIKSLGWQPTTGLEEGFRRTVLSFEDRGSP